MAVVAAANMLAEFESKAVTTKASTPTAKEARPSIVAAAAAAAVAVAVVDSFLRALVVAFLALLFLLLRSMKQKPTATALQIPKAVAAFQKQTQKPLSTSAQMKRLALL